MNNHFNRRRAGVLLHITSLPGPGQCGEIGAEAYNFIRFLHDSGITVWQVLPLGLPHSDGSPYQCMSAHAGNPGLIDIAWLVRKGWLELVRQNDNIHNDYGAVKSNLIAKAFQRFNEIASPMDRRDFEIFCDEKSFWLDDFALYYAIRKELDQCWNQWPEGLKNRDPKSLATVSRRLAHSIEAIKFEQYVFCRQWQELKQFANEQGVLLFGDIPIFVAYDSADVWAHREAFKLDKDGEMTVIAGVPPDYFSATGQRWGNPHYDWEFLKKDKFHWWLDRIKTQARFFDILRIDHFRGFEAAWEIPAEEPTAINGKWVEAPGYALLAAIQMHFPTLSLVAEDLGVITDEVIALRDEFDLPGMNILQFAFNNGSGNPYLPHNCTQNSVVYTGTHDNDTTLGWYQSLSKQEKHRIAQYLGFSKTEMPFTLIGTAFASVANLAIVPMQDVLALGSEFRMNTPGTATGNWQWRFDWGQLTEEYAKHLKELVYLFGRN